MTSTWRPRSAVGHPVNAPSPLRQASTASSNGSYTDSNPPSRSSTLSSNASGNHRPALSQSTRYMESARAKIIEHDEPRSSSALDTYQSMRRALKPTKQSADAPRATTIKSHTSHSRSQSVDTYSPPMIDGSRSPPSKGRPLSMSLSRSDSVRGTGSDESTRSGKNHVHFNPHLEKPELQEFHRSSTKQLRTLSNLAEGGSSEDFTIKSKEQEVAGLHGRRRLQRGNSVRAKVAPSWAGSAWMDQQRQFLQAYEYLCHIGEAKEWIEDIIQKSIPPIVQLDEALRDGVTLAEVVQALFPERRFRIYRGPGLTFRHTDNLAIFFRFLEEVELPDLFWFELVDLYEKKNIPKVIYCIHALSWLLWRKGIVDFRIGNLVGQLQFEDHELESMQKGLDRAGVNMPNFSGMGANFGAEPEPEPVETDEERVDRELAEQEHTVLDLQSQMRGALLRIRLGDTMQALWDSEAWIVDLQSRIRGDFAREIAQYRTDMKNFAVNIQSAARGFLIRSKARDEVWYWKDHEFQVVKVQNLVRGRKARVKTDKIKTQILKQAHGVRQLQAAIRGALARNQVADEYNAAREAESGVKELQAAIRGVLVRRSIEDQLHQVYSEEHQVQTLQTLVRGMLQRKAMQTDRTHLRTQESMITRLQAVARASMVRKVQETVQEDLQTNVIRWESLQTNIRGFLVRQNVQATRKALEKSTHSITMLESAVRGFVTRHSVSQSKKDLRRNEKSILSFQSAARGFILRHQTFELLCQLNEHDETTIAIQSIARAFLSRSSIGQLLMQLEHAEESIIEVQAWARGMKVRAEFAEKMRFYKENMEKVIKIQSFIRGRQQGEAYKVLTTGKNPPVGTVKNFVHLLNDSDFDFDEEIGKFYRERPRVIKLIMVRVRASPKDCRSTCPRK